MVHCNLGAAKCCGYGNDELQGMSFTDLFDKTDQKRLLAMIDAGGDLGIYTEFNLKIVRKSGRPLLIDLSGRRMVGADASWIVFTFHDITDLKNTNEELERKISIRTKDLELAKNKIQTILNSSHQGFLTFGPELIVEENYSLKATQMLGDDIEGKPVAKILNLKTEFINNLAVLAFQMHKWDLLEQFSKTESEVQGRNLSLEFSPLFDGKVVGSVLISVTDTTPIKLLKQKAEKSAKESRSIIKILQSKLIFLNMIESIHHAEVNETDENAVKRYVHTLKGEFAFFECDDVVEVCDIWEDKWARSYQPMDLKSFLSQLRKVLGDFLKKYDSILKINSLRQKEVSIPIEEIKKMIRKVAVSGDAPLMLGALEAILERPVEESLHWLGETWLIAAKSVGKKVEPILWENPISIFIDPYQRLASSLIHAVRNAADHGIELPAERIVLGKPEKGRLVAKLELEDGFYHLYLNDDGRGIQRSLVAKKAAELGIEVPESDEGLAELLFLPEFTTQDKQTQLSGRGVGLGAIREEARLLQGDAKLFSVPNVGLELHVWFKKIPIGEIG